MMMLGREMMLYAHLVESLSYLSFFMHIPAHTHKKRLRVSIV